MYQAQNNPILQISKNNSFINYIGNFQVCERRYLNDGL